MLVVSTRVGSKHCEMGTQAATVVLDYPEVPLLFLCKLLLLLFLTCIYLFGYAGS